MTQLCILGVLLAAISGFVVGLLFERRHFNQVNKIITDATGKK